MSKKEYMGESKERIEKIKQLSKKINNTYSTHVKSREKIDWIVRHLRDSVEMSKYHLVTKKDLINMIEDIVCVVEEEDSND